MNVSRFTLGALSFGAAAALLAACTTHGAMGGPTSALPSIASAAGASEQVLYSFTGGNDGGNAATGLVRDRGGNLYGTTVVGGKYTCGTVFKLTPHATPPWPESVLYNFGCFSDGKNPHGGVAFDPKGNLDGTTVSGGSGPSCGSYGCGVVFQLTPTTESVLHSFTGGRDGFGPGGGVTFDASGNLYGTTPDGGVRSHGIVYEVTSHGQERIVHTFTGGKDGGTGLLGLLLLESGSFYGVTEEGGAHSAGTVFRLTRAGKRWVLSTLYAFKGTPDAASPYGGLVADAAGDLFGTTYYGGANGMGTVFELTRTTKGGYSERVLYSFKGGSDGSSSTSTLVLGGSDLYGTTSAGGGTCGCGTIFRVNATSGAEAVLHAFGNGTDGAYPYYGLTKGVKGVFYGTTVAGGSSGQGAVFEFKP
ncbi:MAG TPA: choice-of-anchor tandem repeat GloVer-containing protein [Candidatus Cybelea sp.]